MISKKAVMGVGVLLIFVSTILVSAVAAGVLIRTTGIIQASALDVASSAQDRLISGVEAFTVYGLTDVNQTAIVGFEFLLRLRAGSPSIPFDTTGFTYISGSNSYNVEINESLTGDSCTFGNLTPGEEFCISPRLGDDNDVLERGESFAVLFELPVDAAAFPEDELEATFQPQDGALESVRVQVPNPLVTNRVRLR